MAETDILKKEGRTYLSPVLQKDLFSKVAGHSSLAKLAKKEPLPFNGIEMMTFTMDDEVNLVAEGGAKARGKANIASKTMVPLKVEYGIRVTDEFLYATEEKKIEILKSFNDGYAKKVARGLDIMAMHGVNPRTKEASALIGTNHFDAGTLKIVTTAGQEDKDVNKAIALFDDRDDINVTGMIMAKKFKTALSELEYENGQAKFPELGWGNEASTLRGLRVDTNSTVSFNGSTDLAIIGDFETYFKYGIAKQIPLQIIQYGDPDNSGRDLSGHNEIYIRSETYLGWAFLDEKAFSRIVSA